jgi:hypothetical protein
MIIGNSKSKQGIRVGEYSPESEDANGVIGWMEPACDKPRWIAWFTKKGDLLLYVEREESGAVVGEPIRVSARA